MKKGKHLNLYNIGTEEVISIKKLAQNISKILRKKILIKSSPLKKGGTKKRLPDISKIKKMGFKQKITINQGLIKTLYFYLR